MKVRMVVVALVAILAVGCSSMGGMAKDDMGMKKDDMAMSKDGMAMMKDGVFLQNGKVMETMNGKTTAVMMDVMLKNGTKIMTDGTVMMKDGSHSMLMDGEFYDLDGMKSMVKATM